MKYSCKEYFNMLMCLGRSECNYSDARRDYEKRFAGRQGAPLPSLNAFRSLHHRVYTAGNVYGSVMRCADAGAPRCLDVEIDEKVLEIYRENPTRSTRSIARELGITHTHVWRVLQEDNPENATRIAVATPTKRVRTSSEQSNERRKLRKVSANNKQRIFQKLMYKLYRWLGDNDGDGQLLPRYPENIFGGRVTERPETSKEQCTERGKLPESCLRESNPLFDLLREGDNELSNSSDIEDTSDLEGSSPSENDLSFQTEESIKLETDIIDMKSELSDSDGDLVLPQTAMESDEDPLKVEDDDVKCDVTDCA